MSARSARQRLCGVLVHGDYGPNNVLLDPAARAVTAVLDWEWAHQGEPVEDLAWCEWIVRMHHPQHALAVDGLFGAYGSAPAWVERPGTPSGGPRNAERADPRCGSAL